MLLCYPLDYFLVFFCFSFHSNFSLFSFFSLFLSSVGFVLFFSRCFLFFFLLFFLVSLFLSFIPFPFRLSVRWAEVLLLLRYPRPSNPQSTELFQEKHRLASPSPSYTSLTSTSPTSCRQSARPRPLAAPLICALVRRLMYCPLSCLLDGRPARCLSGVGW